MNLLHTSATHVSRRRPRGTGLHVLVGGQTAIFVDFCTVLSRKLPLFIGVVVLLCFLLLMVRVPQPRSSRLTAAVMNLLSVGRGVRRGDGGLPVAARRVACSGSTRPARSRPSCR